MSLYEALRVIYSSYNSLDELINPFKLHSRLLDLCHFSFEEKRIEGVYISIMERVNLMHYVISLDKHELIDTLKQSYKYLANVSIEDYKLCCLATIHLKYSDNELSKARKPKVKYKAHTGQLLYYTPGSRVYHVNPDCPALRNAKTILYSTFNGDEVSVCNRCINNKPIYNQVRLNPYDRVYAWLKLGRRDSDIAIRLDGKDLSKARIKDQIIRRTDYEISKK